MSGRFLIDTSIVIPLFAKDPQVTQRLQDAEEVFVPGVVIGELYYGAYKSGRVTQNLARVDDFAASGSVLKCDIGTARLYGAIKSKLRKRGKPIPDNDIWIAALALQHSLTLVARDTHFANVDGLAIETW